VLACKGSSVAMNVDWRMEVQGKNTSQPGMHLYHVDTIRSQLALDAALHDLKPEDPGGTSLYFGSLAEHEDFLQQIINDAPVTSKDRSNNDRESWQKIVDSIPNDYRDLKRYARIAMLVATRGAPIRPRGEIPHVPTSAAPTRIRQLQIRGR
jgi:hypothetical protein